MLHSRDGVSTTFIFIKDINFFFLMLSNTCIMIPDSFFVFDHIKLLKSEAKNTSVRLTRVVLLHFLEKTGLFSDIQQQIYRGASLVSHKSVLS